MRAVTFSLLAVLIVAAVAGSGALLLRACGLGTPPQGLPGLFLGMCPAPEQEAAKQRLLALNARSAELERTIAYLERELAETQCTVEYEVPAAPPPAPEIDAEGWRDQDIASMEGCWTLTSDYTVTREGTDISETFDHWTMCFGASGRGEQELSSPQGTICSGPVTAAFQSGSFVVREPGNTPCARGFIDFIYQRITTCSLGADNTAQCAVEYPHSGFQQKDVELRRTTGVLPNGR